MEQYNRGTRIRKLILGIVFCAIVTAAAIAVYLIYKGNFNSTAYSNMLFYASMLYILVGGLSAGGSYMSVNSFSYKYASTVMSSSYDERKKIDDILINSSINFAMRMIAAGLLLLLASAAADKLL